jgi:hypothetical protein
MSKKYPTTEAIIDAIDKERAWRIVELSAIKKSVETAKERSLFTAVRQGILLLYAHWEGFVKMASIAYLQFIVDQKFKQHELTDNYRCILFRNQLRTCAEAHAIKIHISAVDLILNKPNEYVIFDPENQIKTKSNLNYKLFEDILETLAIDKTRASSPEFMGIICSF